MMNPYLPFFCLHHRLCRACGRQNPTINQCNGNRQSRSAHRICSDALRFAVAEPYHPQKSQMPSLLPHFSMRGPMHEGENRRVDQSEESGCCRLLAAIQLLILLSVVAISASGSRQQIEESVFDSHLALEARQLEANLLAAQTELLELTLMRDHRASADGVALRSALIDHIDAAIDTCAPVGRAGAAPGRDRRLPRWIVHGALAELADDPAAGMASVQG